MVLTDLTTLIVGYVLYFVCFVLIIIRLGTTWTRNKRWASDDYWMVFAFFILMLRVAVIHLTLVYNTNNIENPETLSVDEQHRRAFGSKMALAARCCYATFIWCMKFCILALYARIVEQLDEYRKFIKYIWAFLFLSWVAVMVSTLMECRPFHLYWQVVPNPGRACTEAEGQLYATGAFNIATDLILILYPIPIIFHTRLPQRLKIQLYSLFSLGFFVILVSIFRLPFVIENNSLQSWRTLFASIEIQAACVVANAPILYRLIVDSSHRLHSSGRDQREESVGRGYWFSANHSVGRRGVGIEDLEFTGLGDAEVGGGGVVGKGWGVGESVVVDEESSETGSHENRPQE